MKKFIVLALLLPLIAIGGCAYTVPDIPIEPSPTVPVEPTEPEPSDVQLVDETVNYMASGSLFFTPTSEETDFVVLAPAYFEFGTVSPSSTIDTWTEDSYLQVGRNKVNYKQGDPLYFIIFNDSINAYTFEIRYEDTVNDLTWSEATQLAYHKAPLGVKQAVAIADSSVELQAGEAITIPFSVTLPEDMEYPLLWEFRLSILRKDPGSMQEVGGKIRVFVSMK